MNINTYSIPKVSTPEGFLNFIKGYVIAPANIDILGMAHILRIRACLIITKTSIRYYKSDLGEILIRMGYSPRYILDNGFPFDAFITTLDYYASIDNHFAPIFLKTIKTFDCEFEIAKLKNPGIFYSDIEAIRKQRYSSHYPTSNAYLEYVRIMGYHWPERLYNYAEPEEPPIFLTSPDNRRSQDPDGSFPKLSTPQEVYRTLKPYLLPPANISAKGIAKLLEIPNGYFFLQTRKEVKPIYLQRFLRRLYPNPEELIEKGFTFVAFLVTLEYYASRDNKIAKALIIAIESADFELKIFRRLNPDKSVAKFLRERYWQDHDDGVRQFNSIRGSGYKSTIIQKYKEQLATYPYNDPTKPWLAETESSS